MPHAFELLALTIDATDVAVVAAISSLAVSWFSLALSWRADSRAGAIERRTKQAELALAAGRAAGPHGRDGKWFVRPRVAIRNVGIGTARRVRAWLVDAEGEAVSTVGGGELTLARGDEEVWLAVEVDRDVVPEGDLPRLRWRVAWHDDDGGHERTTDTHAAPRG